MSARRLVWGVFVAFAGLYALSIGRGFYSSDGQVMFQTTAALVERGTWALERDPGLPQIVPGQGGATYSKYDPGLSLAMVPFYVAGDRIAAINAAHRYHVAATAVLLLPALAAAGAVAGAARLALALSGDPRRAVVVALAAGIASPLWWYGRVLFAEALLACVLVWCVGLALRGYCNTPLPFHTGRVRSRVFVAGIVFGAGIATRAAFAVFLPAVFVGLLRAAESPLSIVSLRAQRSETSRMERGESPRESVGRGVRPVLALTLFLLGTMPGVIAVLAHNALRFGDPLQTGYAGEGFTTPPWQGVAGLLISPGRGALVIAPPLLLSAILWPRLRRASPALAGFLAPGWGAALLFYGAWWAWDGGWCWGPRFLVPLIPLSMVPLALVPAGRAWRGSVIALVALGAAINAPPVLVDIVPHFAGEQAANIDRVNWTIRAALPVAAWRDLIAGRTEPLALFHLHETGLPPVWSVGVPLVCLSGLVVGVMLLARGAIYRTPPK